MSNSRPHLSVGAAIKAGWTAFNLAPWAFVGFLLLSGVLAQLANFIPFIGGLISLVINLWGGVGLIRGAWMALEGQAPSFADFTRWNGVALWRLFNRQFVLALVLVPFALLFLGVLMGAADAWSVLSPLMNLALTVDPSDPQLAEAGATAVKTLAGNIATSPLAVATIVIAWLFATYIQVNQTFLGFIALLEDRGPIATITRGITVVQGQWWEVLALLILQVVIVLIGFLACLVGLFAAAPVCLCITGAAYRQLFGTTDAGGLLSDPSSR